MIRTRRTFQNKVISGINITPFTDVVLVLLIIFMLTAPAWVPKTSGIDNKLPKADQKAQFPMAVPIVRIEQGPLLYFNNAPVTYDTFGAELAKCPKAEDGSLQIIIKADANVPYGDVVRVMDIAGKNGATDTLLATRPASTPDATVQP